MNAQTIISKMREVTKYSPSYVTNYNFVAARLGGPQCQFWAPPKKMLFGPLHTYVHACLCVFSTEGEVDPPPSRSAVSHLFIT